MVMFWKPLSAMCIVQSSGEQFSRVSTDLKTLTTSNALNARSCAKKWQLCLRGCRFDAKFCIVFGATLCMLQYLIHCGAECSTAVKLH